MSFEPQRPPEKLMNLRCSRDGERKFRWAAYQSPWTAVALCSVATVTESLALNS